MVISRFIFMCQRVRQPLYLWFVARASHSCPAGFRRKGARPMNPELKSDGVQAPSLFIGFTFHVYFRDDCRNIFCIQPGKLYFSCLLSLVSCLLFLYCFCFLFLPFIFFTRCCWFSFSCFGFRVLVFGPGSRLSCTFFIHSFCTACVFDSVVPPKSFITRQVT